MKEKLTKAPHPVPRPPSDDLADEGWEKELKSNSTLRTCIVSLIGIAFSAALVYLGVIWRNNNTMTNFLPVKGEVPGIMAELLIALGGALFTIFAISLIWELFVRRSWLREMRHYIFRALCSPQARRYSDTTDWQLEILHQIMTNLSEKRVSDLLHLRFKAGTFSPEKSRKNLHYEAILSDMQQSDENYAALASRFFNAHFEIKFSAVITESDSLRKVRLLFRNNSSDISDLYYQALEEYDGDIYRYILLTNCENDFASTPAIKVVSCKIVHKRKVLNYSVKQSDKELGVILLTIHENLKSVFKECVGDECEISLVIETFVDKQYPFYPMMFGYPVDTFITKFSINSNDVSGVSLVPFFISDESFIHDSTGTHQGTSWASGHINGLSLPNSSLVYVWNTAPSVESK